MNKETFSAKRASLSYRQTIEAPATAVFPLICPVREAEWLEGWACTLLHSKSGFAEEGCVFTSQHEGERDTVWLITKHDEVEKVVEFARLTPGSRIAKLRVAIEDAAAGTSQIDITYDFTGLSEEGNRFIEEFAGEKFEQAMKFWEDSMNYYLKTGKQLKTD